MKRILSICIIFIMIFSLSSCIFLRPIVPESITFDGQTYMKAFTAEFFPNDYPPGSADATEFRIGFKSYYHLTTTYFDSCVGYTVYGEPEIYFNANQYDEAIAYFENPENFNYFCLVGNIVDKTDHYVCSVPNMDPLMLDKLTDFILENGHTPFKSNSQKASSVPLIGDEWKDGEFYFYKATKSGDFLSIRDTLRIVDGRIVLLHYYDFDGETGNQKMIYVDLPDDLNEYFLSVLSDLNVKI